MPHAQAYIHTAWRETSPGWLLALAAMLGFRHSANGPLAICDLACGTGYSAALTAACVPSATVDGFDADAGHIEMAERLAKSAALGNIRFDTADIRRLADDPPRTYDIIVVHGVLSWVQPDVREAIFRFAGSALKDGGIAYLHYACQPGASTLAVLNGAMRASAPAGTPMERLQKIRPLLAPMRRGAGLFVAHPQAGTSWDSLASQPDAYVAHELAGDTFEPLSSGDVITAMSAHGSAFAGSATPIENVDRMSLPQDCLAALEGVGQTPLREVLKDIARDQALRRDIYVKNGRPLTPQAHMDALAGLRFRRMADVAGGAVTVQTRVGPVEGAAAIFAPLLDAFASGDRGFDELARLPPFSGRPGLLNQSLVLLMEGGLVRPVWPGADRAGARAFNHAVSSYADAPALADAELMGPRPL
ncbi:class I SAM-dependent methyltransferase [Aureimonas altamirensis]|uniref:class I SAM-dependent methyltransferase n=1 Tax=Aureimonas altamirensis TaxID=370622 RepID=UPI001E4F0C02|nr:class I SAM-dependent methyltransferase [Aureimonas altamirensis]UHD46817.1 class I SAM-dependent methyltransferase [Aureimonas altamirensis]